MPIGTPPIISWTHAGAQIPTGHALAGFAEWYGKGGDRHKDHINMCKITAMLSASEKRGA